MKRFTAICLIALTALVFGQEDRLIVRVGLPLGLEARSLSGFGLPLARDAHGAWLLETDEQGLADLSVAGFEVALDAGQTWPSRIQGKQLTGIPGYPCYPTNGEVFDRLAQLASSYPDLLHLEDIGDSWEKAEGLGGADLVVAVLTNHQVPGPKPALFVCSGLHARELSPTGMTMGFAEALLAGYGHEGDATWLLDAVEIHLLILANPDGRAYVEQPSPISWRKNTDNDFCTGSNGRGVDLNRNYGFQWGLTASCSSSAQCSNTFRGPSAGSEPEIQAIQAYVQSIFPDQRGPNLGDPAPADAEGVFIDLHSYAGQVLWPYGFDNTVAPNGAALTTLGRKFAWFNGYSPEKASYSFDTCGTSDDFNYGSLGVAAFTFEMGNAFFEPCSNFDDTIWPDNSKALFYAAKVARAPYLWPSGPNVESAQGSSSSLVPGQPLRIVANLSDDRFQVATNPAGVEPVQNVSAAEVFADGAPWEGGPALAMSAQDGAFDSPTETAELALATGSMALGSHVLLVRGTDSSGAVGAPTGVLVKVADGATVLALTGQVVELGSGTPLAATVSCAGETAHCDPQDGRFYLAVSPGTHALQVQLADYNPVTLNISGSAGQSSTLAQIVMVPLCSNLVDLSASTWSRDGGWSLVADEGDALMWDESPDGDYENGSASHLVTAPLRLPRGGEARLTHRYQLDPYGADEAVVEAKVNGGPWQRLARFHGDGGSDLRVTHVNLPAGESVQLRFTLDADEAFGGDGWQLTQLTLWQGGSCVLPLLVSSWPNNGITVLQILNYL